MDEADDRPVAHLRVTSDEHVDPERVPAFLRLRSVRLRVESEDGWRSEEGTWDFVERPLGLDAVVVLVWRRGPAGVEVLLRQGLRVPASMGRAEQPHGPGRHPAVFVDEVVAGLVEHGEYTSPGRATRALQEVLEETGLRLGPAAITPLGGPLWATPGLCAEILHFFAADATGVAAESISGDGSPFEALARTLWLPLDEALLRVCGAAPDAPPSAVGDMRAELALRRLAARVP